MQLYAQDKQKNLVFAKHAIKQQDYFCLECKTLVHVRGGVHRQTHYYHCNPSKGCRQSSKSIQHLQVQFYIQSLLPKGECLLEHRFPDIGRIADVLWETQKLIFEIQCSPISSTEVLERNADYATKGYQVIWIFHDSQYNQYCLSAAESALYDTPHYFTNIDANGKGVIYDLFAFYQQGLRKKMTPIIPFEPNLPKRNAILIPKSSSSIFKQRKKWSLYFSGDVFDRFLNGDENMLRYHEQIEKEEEHPKPNWKDRFKLQLNRWILRPYFLVFQIILERFCR